MKCIRCGRELNIEQHHIKHKVNGGSNEPDNLEPRCRDCHKYQHTKETLLLNVQRYAEELKRESENSRRYKMILANLKMQLHRLEVLNELNTVELITERGYTSYWVDSTTHKGSGFKFK